MEKKKRNFTKLQLRKGFKFGRLETHVKLKDTMKAPKQRKEWWESHHQTEHAKKEQNRPNPHIEFLYIYGIKYELSNNYLTETNEGISGGSSCNWNWRISKFGNELLMGWDIDEMSNK